MSALREGQALTGYFRLPDAGDEVPGVLTWSFGDGASLELIGETSGWPGFGTPHFVIHGALRDGGDLSLVHTWVKDTTFDAQVTQVRSSTLALGDHVVPQTPWSRAVYSTAGLTEWRRDTGLEATPPGPGTPPGSVRVDWRPPERTEVELPGARLLFQGRRDFSLVYAADWTIYTWQELVVELEEASTLDELWRSFGSPLLSLTTFASDRPDGIVRERLIDATGRTNVEIWRQGDHIQPPEWDTRRYVFHADDLPNFEEAIASWWALEKQLRPALGLFADHIRRGRSYDASRFLTLYTAIETYSRARLGRNSLRSLRDLAGVPDEVIGCTDVAIALIGASRQYFAHLGRDPHGPTAQEIEDNMLQSTRRASALLQACLLREVGFTIDEIETRLRAYYSNWPLG